VLRSVLADPSLACTGFIAMDERDCYLAAGAALDFAVVAIDFASCTGKDDALARFARALRFPEWFGGNWDALQDCLSDLSWLDRKSTRLNSSHVKISYAVFCLKK